MHLFETDHWLSNPKNVMVLKLTRPAWKTGVASAAAAPEPEPAEAMKSFSADGLGAFLRARDLAGPAATLFASGVNGADLLEMTPQVLVNDVRLTAFAARKVVDLRDAFLAKRA